MRPEDWIAPAPPGGGGGLLVAPGGYHIDPSRPVDRAVITHGHADHARAGHGHVLATPETIAIMRSRYGDGAARHFQALPCGEPLTIGETRLTLHPAGHILGSAMAVVEHRGCRVAVSGDYKRRRDPTCAPFEPVRCDVFVTEATFGLPVFRHPDDAAEIGKLLASLRLFPERTHLVGVYALGKCQRLIRLLREAGHDRPIWLHGALQALCDLYEAHGIALGPLRPVAEAPDRDTLRGEIVLAPPSAAGDRWLRRLPDPRIAMASGWMRVRARARQRNAELPLVISDHADWDELLQTIAEMGAPEVWITHGREEALMHAATAAGHRARALALVGRGDEDEEPDLSAPGATDSADA
ncbi:ligase-associated DNA damage response exonuclease [Marinibaculum pumilum]|uniref:Ligase-associated DNA damage response exonuclease n=1 Tax=Marinibaculum pumilum TaxID=1766165 RepID=A0ABV7KX31_9PROT